MPTTEEQFTVLYNSGNKNNGNNFHISRSGVISAIEEFELKGQESFLDEYGYDVSTKYLLQDMYPPKAICGVAYKYSNPGEPALQADDFSSGVGNGQAVSALRKLGFSCLEKSKYVYGEIPGITEGHLFTSRLDARDVHRPPIGGISGNKSTPAESIVVSGGYSTDEDYGDLIIYTGHGGQNDKKEQIADQDLEDSGNAGMVLACEQSIPIRVIRGSGGDPKYSPPTGYRYDGLFKILSYYPGKTDSGYKVWLFELKKLSYLGLETLTEKPPLLAEETEIKRHELPKRISYVSYKIVRDTKISRHVKEIHNYRCQICQTQIRTRKNFYAEGAHIQPLGGNHKGPDTPSNILCLCPNCHVEFDNFFIFIDDDFCIYETKSRKKCGELSTLPTHIIDLERIRYHKRICHEN